MIRNKLTFIKSLLQLHRFLLLFTETFRSEDYLHDFKEKPPEAQRSDTAYMGSGKVKSQWGFASMSPGLREPVPSRIAPDLLRVDLIAPLNLWTWAFLVPTHQSMEGCSLTGCNDLGSYIILNISASDLCNSHPIGINSYTCLLHCFKWGCATMQLMSEWGVTLCWEKVLKLFQLFTSILNTATQSGNPCYPTLCTVQIVLIYSGVIRGRDVYMLQFSWHKPRWVGEALQFLFIFTNAMLTCKAKLYLTETLHALSTLGGGMKGHPSSSISRLPPDCGSLRNEPAVKCLAGCDDFAGKQKKCITSLPHPCLPCLLLLRSLPTPTPPPPSHVYSHSLWQSKPFWLPSSPSLPRRKLTV